MDLIIIAAIGLCMGLVFLAMGLSFIDFGLGSLNIADSYNTTVHDYYQNPLHRLNSKYFHYRPKGSVVVSKKQWNEIERNIGIKIAESQKAGKMLGYKEAIVDIRLKVKEEKEKITPSSPYATLDVESSTPTKEIEKKYEHFLAIYNPRNFNHLDKAFAQLAELRIEQIKRAWSKINTGIGNKGQY